MINFFNQSNVLFVIIAIRNNCSLVNNQNAMYIFLKNERGIGKYNMDNGKMNIIGLSGRINAVKL